ncbi:MAG: SAM-dependent methyltransferase, partial [Thermoanaerobaculia bacterium]
SLKRDERVVLMEGLNARYFKEEFIPEKVDLITVDVSFISLKLIIPPLIPALQWKGYLLALFKPQFEVGKKDVGKGGIVRKIDKVLEKMEEIINFAKDLKLKFIGSCPSPIKGQKGNQEYFLLFQK